MSAEFDDDLRAAAFAYLEELRRLTGGLVSRADLTGFAFKGAEYA